MDRIPFEVITRHSARKIGDYITEKVEGERRNGKVAVLVEDFLSSFYFMPCDTHGYPVKGYMSFATFDPMSIVAFQEGSIPTHQNITVEETTIYCDSPMLTQRYDWQDKPYVFLWKGKVMNKNKIPIEKLNVSELMKLAQAAIINREGLVIDEALKNKVYK